MRNWGGNKFTRQAAEHAEQVTLQEVYEGTTTHILKISGISHGNDHTVERYFSFSFENGAQAMVHLQQNRDGYIRKFEESTQTRALEYKARDIRTGKETDVPALQVASSIK